MTTIASFVLGSAITAAVVNCWTGGITANNNDVDDSEETAATTTFPPRSNMSAPTRSSQSSPPQVNFLTDLIQALWPEINASISMMIQDSCKAVFATMSTPKLKVTKVQLGTVPIIMDNIHVSRLQHNNHSKSAAPGSASSRGSIRLTMDVAWNGNCDMEFQTSSPFVVKFGIEKVKFYGRLVCYIYPLSSALPLIGAIQYAFVHPPKIDLTFTGLASIAEGIEFLQKTVQSTIESSLTPYVLPNKNLYKMDPSLTLVNIYQPPLGVLRITVVKGTGFVVHSANPLIPGSRPDIPDVYCQVHFGGSGSTSSTTTSATTTFTTSVIKNSTAPTWDNNNSFDVLVYDMDQIITIHAWDKDTGRFDSDDHLGTASTTAQDLILSTSSTSAAALVGCTLELQSSQHHPTGASVTITGQLLKLVPQMQLFQTKLRSMSLSSPPPISPTNNSPRYLYGLLTVLVQGAAHLPLASKAQASSFVKVKLVDNNANRKPTAKASSDERVTATVVDCMGGEGGGVPVVDALNPVYEAIMEFPLTWDRLGYDVVLELWNCVGATSDGSPTKKKVPMPLLLGSITVTFLSLLSQADADGAGTFHGLHHAIGSQGATLDFTVMLRSVKTPPPTPVALETGNMRPAVVLPTTTTPGLNDDSEKGSTISSISPGTTGGIGGGETLTLRILCGSGFPIQKHRLRKSDIPDIYLCIRCGTNPYVWRTPTVANSTNPVWKDSTKATHNFIIPHGSSALAQTIELRAFDEDKGRRDKDDPQGQARVSVKKILLESGVGGSLEVELHDEITGLPLGRYVTIQCQVSSSRV